MRDAQLMVLVRSVKLNRSEGPRDGLAGHLGYLKFDLKENHLKTDVFQLASGETPLGETFVFPIRQDALGEEDTMFVRLKVMKDNMLNSIVPKKAKTLHGTVGIQVKAIAQIGSPSNYGNFPLLSDVGAFNILEGATSKILNSEGLSEPQTRQVGTVEIAIFWCRESDLPTSSTLCKKRRFPFVMQNTPKKVGVDDLEKDSCWEDNDRGGLADWTRHSRLVVRVLEAKDLQVADIGGSSDPYCIVQCRGSKYKTEVRKRTLCPTWSKGEFRFGPGEGIEPDDAVHFIVRDKDTMFDEDLGHVVVPLWSLFDGNRPAGIKWLQLQRTGRQRSECKIGSTEPLGWIRVEVTFTVPRTPATLSHFTALDGTELRPGKYPTLFVWLIQARNLNPADNNGFSDPFCKLTLNEQTFESRVKRKTLNPRWEKRFVFGSEFFFNDSDSLEVTVIDHDLGIREGISNDTLGSVSIPVSFFREAAFSGKPMWWTLGSDEFDVAGEVQLAARYMPSQTHAEDDKAYDYYFGKEWECKLNVAVLEGRALSPHNSGFYCKIICGDPSVKSRKKTKVRKGSHPVWNEKFDFTESVDSSRAGLGRMDRLVVMVYEHKTDRAVGKVDLSVGSLIDRMGYLDKQGWSLCDHFDLAEMSQRDTTLLQDSDPPGSPRASKPARAKSDGSAAALSPATPTGSSSTSPFSPRSIGSRAASGLRKTIFHRRSHSAQSAMSRGSDGDLLDLDAEGRAEVNGDDSERGEDDSLGNAARRALNLSWDDLKKSTTNSVAYAARRRNSSGAGSQSGSGDQSPRGRKSVESDTGGDGDGDDVEAGILENEEDFDDEDFDELLSRPDSLSERKDSGGSQGSAPSIRLLIRIQPVSELRLVKTEKLALYMNKLSGVLPDVQASGGAGGLVSMSTCDLRVPTALYAKVRMGFEEIESREVEFSSFDDGACNLSLHFMLDSFGSLLKSAKALKPDSSNQPRLDISIIDSRSDLVLAESSWTMHEVNEMLDISAESSVTCKMVPRQFPSARPQLELALGKVNGREVLRPILGYLSVALVQLKISKGTFSKAYRTIIKYKDRVISTRDVKGDLSIQYKSDEQSYTFEVYDMFSPVTIEVHERNIEKKAQVEYDCERSLAWRHSKKSSVVGRATITIFELLELEAQIVHADKSLTKTMPWPKIKLPIKPTKGKEKKGFIWIRASYKENVGQMMLPNPKPALRNPKVSTFAIATELIREISRTTKLLGALGGSVGGSVGFLFNWESTAASIVGIGLTIMFCCIPLFAERILMLPIYGLLVFIMKKHRGRMTGHFVRSLTKEARAKDTNAIFRIAVIQVRNVARRSFVEGPGSASPLSDLGSPVPTLDEIKQQEGHDFTNPFQQAKGSAAPKPPMTPMWKRPVARIRSIGTTFGKALVGRSNASTTNGTSTPNLGAGGQSGIFGSESDLLSPIMEPNDSLSIRAAVSIRKRFGAQNQTTKLGYTNTQTSKQQVVDVRFTGTKHGYRDNQSQEFSSELVEWENFTGTYPAFQGEIHYRPVHALVLVVNVIAAENLIAKDRDMTSDPFIKIDLRSKHGTRKEPAPGEPPLRSEIRYKTLNPTWNQEFVFGCGSAVSRDDVVHIQVLDDDGKYKASDSLGSLHFKVFDMAKQLGKGAPKWVPLGKPEDFTLFSGQVESSAASIKSANGAIKISVRVYNFMKAGAAKELMFDSNTFLTSTVLERATEAKLLLQDSDQAKNASDSWRRSSAEIVVDVEEVNLNNARKKPVAIGTARIPIAALVADEEGKLKQAAFHDWVPLSLRKDGTHHDAQIEDRVRNQENQDALGEVLVRAELILPDPNAKLRLMEIESAKRRATSLSPLEQLNANKKKFLAIQAQLFHFNNKLEQVRNLFNWSHPTKTELIFKLVLFLCVLFTIVPSRHIVMFIALFMFTEYFRKMGTASLRLNHLIALVPTDEELHSACEGSVLSAKRTWDDKKADDAIVSDSQKRLLGKFKAHQGFSLGSDIATALQIALPFKMRPCDPGERLTVEDLEQGLASQLRVLVLQSTNFSSAKQVWKNAHFFTANALLKWWKKSEQFKALQSADGRIDEICAVSTKMQVDELEGCLRPDLCFAIYAKPTVNSDKMEKIVLLANNTAKKERWLTYLYHDFRRKGKVVFFD